MLRGNRHQNYCPRLSYSRSSSGMPGSSNFISAEVKSLGLRLTTTSWFGGQDPACPKTLGEGVAHGGGFCASTLVSVLLRRSPNEHPRQIETPTKLNLMSAFIVCLLRSEYRSD